MSARHLVIRTGVYDEINRAVAFLAGETADAEVVIAESAEEELYRYTHSRHRFVEHGNSWRRAVAGLGGAFDGVVVLHTGNRIGKAFGCLLGARVRARRRFLVDRDGAFRPVSRFGLLLAGVRLLLSRKSRNYALSRLSAFWGLERNLGRPSSAMAETAGLCNLRCPGCPAGLRTQKRALGMMSWEQYRPLMDELAPTLWYANLQLYGEPFLNRDLVRMIRHAYERGVDYIELSSNGNVELSDGEAEELVASGLSKIIVSMDGFTQGVYERYRVGGDVERLKRFVRRLMAARKRLGRVHPVIDVQFLESAANREELEAVAAFQRETGADNLKVKAMWLNVADLTPEEASRFAENEAMMRDYAVVDGALIRRRRAVTGSCDPTYTQMIVTWNGDLVPCCIDAYISHILGNAFAGAGALALWNGPRYRALRRGIRRNLMGIPLCRKYCGGVEG